MYLFLALIVVPLIEIALFITVGERIGLAWTLAIVIATALLGAVTLRRQGVQTLQKLRALRSDMEAPAIMIEGLLIALAGVLLLTPGFLTDTIGFLLLTPPIRAALAKRAVRSAILHVRSGGFGAAPTEEPPREAPRYEAETPPPRGPRNPDSPWSADVDRSEADEAVILEDEPGRRPDQPS